LVNLQLQKGEIIKNVIATDINNDQNIDIIITFLDTKGNNKTIICLGIKDKKTDFTTFSKTEVFINSEFVLGDFDGDRM